MVDRVSRAAEGGTKLSRALTIALLAAPIVAAVLFAPRVLGAGTYTSPEGAVIEVSSVGPWTTDQIYRMLRENGLDSKIGPTLTVKVQDVYSSQTSTSVQGLSGSYSGFKAIIYLKGTDSSFAIAPDAVLGHEFGHAWTLYHLYMDRQGDWSSYLSFRGLIGDPRVDSTYAWSKNEMIADDYRLVLGSQAARDEQPLYINSGAPAPATFSGFADFFLNTWAKPGSVAPTPTPAPAPTLTPSPSPSSTAAPSASPTTTPTPTSAPTSSASAATALLANLSASPQSFRKATKVSFALNAPAALTAMVLDGAGRTVRTLVAATYLGGNYTLTWDGSDAIGTRVPSGTYTVRLVAIDSLGRADSAQVAVSLR